VSIARTLALLLAAQLVLAVVTWWPADRSALVPHRLIEGEVGDVARLRIAAAPEDGAEPSWLELTRAGEDWTIASSAGYPAEAEKVTALLEKLLAMEIRAPIATGSAHHNALSVGEQEYGRQLELDLSGETIRLVVGAARSDHVNVRYADEDEVYLARGISEFAINDAASHYWNATYLAAPADELTSLQIQSPSGPIEFVREESGWTLAELGPGEVADAAAIESMIGKLTVLEMLEPVGEDELAEHALDGGLRVTWTQAATDESVAGGYRVGDERAGRVFVKSDAHAFVVTVAPSQVEALRAAERADFVRSADGDAAAEAES
jgi:hypothetical protein